MKSRLITNSLTLIYKPNKMETEEEFLGALKMVTGEELLSKVTHVNDDNGNYVILDNPILVEEVTMDTRVGAKVSPWMKFSKERSFIVPMDRIVTCVECDIEVEMFYNLSLEKIDPEYHKRTAKGDGNLVSPLLRRLLARKTLQNSKKDN